MEQEPRPNLKWMWIGIWTAVGAVLFVVVAILLLYIYAVVSTPLN
jgi:hypothetical protein